MSSLALLGAGPETGITANTAFAAAVVADAPLAYYRFQEPSGSTIADSSGNGQTGGKTGSPTMNKTGPLTGGKAVGGFTTNDFFTIPAGVSFTAGHAISVEYFVNPSSAVASSVFTIGNAASPNLCQCHCPYSDGNVYWDYGANPGGGRLSGAFGALSGAWIHMVLTASTNSMVIYKNGSLLFSQASWVPPIASIGGGNIGFFSAGGAENADIAEFAVYGTALSAGRVSAHFAAIS